LNLDDIADQFYKKFAVELFNKRLSVFNLPDGPARLKVADRLPALEPREEARLYAREAGATSARHLSEFFARWEALGLTSAELAALRGNDALDGAGVLESTLACIALTRWLRDGKDEPPLRCKPVSRASPRGLRAGAYLSQLVRSIEHRYEIGTAKATRESAH